MNLAMLLEMASDGFGKRVALGPLESGCTYGELLERARRAAGWLGSQEVERAVLVDVNSEAVPLLLFGSALAGVPFVPVNYRLADEALRSLLARTAPSVAVAGEGFIEKASGVVEVKVVERPHLLAVAAGRATDAQADEGPLAKAADPDDVAVLLFTSGTTGEPKAAVLRHKHLTSYVISTVDFMGAGEEECALVSVPPYHVAGIAAVLSSVYSGRRIVQLESFTPEGWIDTAARERVTHAMVVPTMLSRVVELLEDGRVELPELRHLSYGGGRMPQPVLERALELLPHVGFVNAYGLTETSSTISVLGPEDHRLAQAGSDPGVRRRLASVGRPLPGIELEVRDENGQPLPPGEVGEITVRGEQVAGEYLTGPTSIATAVGGDSGGPASGSRLADGGWFPTRDSGWVDEDGYLFVEGRLDDVIVRGGENLSPGEIEEVLILHPGIRDAAVVGLPDKEWGEKVVAAVVAAGPTPAPSEADVKEWVKERLRSSRTPERVVFLSELPYNDTGKLLRRILRQQLAETSG